MHFSIPFHQMLQTAPLGSTVKMTVKITATSPLPHTHTLGTDIEVSPIKKWMPFPHPVSQGSALDLLWPTDYSRGDVASFKSWSQGALSTPAHSLGPLPSAMRTAWANLLEDRALLEHRWVILAKGLPGSAHGQLTSRHRGEPAKSHLPNLPLTTGTRSPSQDQNSYLGNPETCEQ